MEGDVNGIDNYILIFYFGICISYVRIIHILFFFRLFGHTLSPLYPNPLGSHGKTIQSQVNCDTPDLGQLVGWLVGWLVG